MWVQRCVFLSIFALLLCSGPAKVSAQSSSASDLSSPSWLVPSSELDNDLPSWLRFSGEERARAEGDVGISFKDSSDRYVLNRLRLDMKILPLKWLKFEVQSQDSRAFGREEAPKSPYVDPWDLRLAYAEVGDIEAYHSIFRVGRQELAFGDQRLIGNSNWTNAARSFDGYRTAVQYGRFRVDAFAASVVVLTDGQVGDHTPGNYIEGLYGDMADVVPDSTIQPYFLWRRSPGQKDGAGHVGTEDFGTTGVRWAGKLPRGFDYNTESAIQRGSLRTNSVAAWATHNLIGYQLPFAATIHPRYVAEFNYASGDNNAKDTVHGTFDTLYASGHDKIEFDDQVGWKNVEDFRTGVDLRAGKKLKCSLRYADIYLANAHDSLYASNGSAVVTRANGTAGRWVGQEFDATFVYPVAKSAQLGAGYGYLLPGTFLKDTTPGKSFSYPFFFYDTRF